MHRCIWIVTLVASVLGVSACNRSMENEMDTMIDIGTHNLHIRCTGQGYPAVVIDTGIGDGAARWIAFQDQIARYTRVCTYDRAGYGSSEPGPMPRHGEQVADELARLMEKAKVKEPYVIVGHSLGGLHAQILAGRYPERVAGLILLDPSPLPFITGNAFPKLYQMLRQQTSELQQTARKASQELDPEIQTKANYLSAIASEHAALVAETAVQVTTVESFGALPLVVVGSGQPNPAFGEPAKAFQEFWIEQNRVLATKSSQGKFVLAQESGHYLHEDAPDLILSLVEEMVKQCMDYD